MIQTLLKDKFVCRKVAKVKFLEELISNEITFGFESLTLYKIWIGIYWKA
jgi:hypothetical protein